MVAREVGSQSVFVFNDRFTASSRALKAAGVSVQQCPTNPIEGDCWPIGAVETARSRFPFIMDVRWEFGHGPLGGLGGGTLTFCVFGFAVYGVSYTRWIS